MSANPLARSLKRQITQLQKAMTEFDEAGRKMGQAAMEIGQLLIEIKPQIPHGEWEDWVQENLGRSSRMAQRWMRFTKQERDFDCITPEVIRAHWIEFTHPKGPKQITGDTVSKATHVSGKDSGATRTYGNETAQKASASNGPLPILDAEVVGKEVDNEETGKRLCPRCHGSGYIEESDDPAAKEKYGEFVTLSNGEYTKLCEKFGTDGARDRIERLDNYIGAKGKRYKSHYRTILMWEGKNGATQDTAQGSTKRYRRDFEYKPGEHEGVVVSNED